MATSLAIFAAAICISIVSASNQEAGRSSVNYEKVRVITDLEVINSRNGVPIELWYNETHENPDGLASVAGCPQSIDGIPWIYYGQPLRCYLAGTYASCPPDNKLLSQQGSPYGVCACECLTDYDFSKQLQGPDRYVRCFREQKSASIRNPNEQIFDKTEKKCYFMYTRGPCKKRGTVLTDMTPFSLECLPLCDEKMPGWEEQEEAGLCKRPKFVLAATNGLEVNQCPSEDEFFSKTLKKCIRRFFGKTAVVG